MRDLRRRDFLRILGLAGSSAAVGGCSDTGRKLIPYIIPPEDIIPGEASWYSTTCRECPAGCGVLAKNRDGRVIKLEGSPSHPINRGALCIRGQASLHGLYNPDRYSQPLLRQGKDQASPILWEKGEEVLIQRLQETLGKGKRIVFLTDLKTGTECDLIRHWLSEAGQSDGLVLYEPFAYEALRKANQLVFGYEGIPNYRIDEADFLISFGAGFLETWLSNVEYARQFSTFHRLRSSGKNPFVYVGPRQSVTAANADIWIPVKPGDEYLVALGVLRIILDDKLHKAMSPEQASALSSMLAQWPMERIIAKTGVDEHLIRLIASQFAASSKPLALAGGLALCDPNATAAAVAANLLCAVAPGTQTLVDPSEASSYGETARAEEMKELFQMMRDGEIGLLLIQNANPVFSFPSSWEVRKSIESVPFVVSFSSCNDETTSLAHLVLPTHTPLESWGDYSPRKGVAGLMQPVMGPVFNTKHLGDILVSTGKKLKGEERFPWSDFYEVLQHSWNAKWKEAGSPDSFLSFWESSVRKGGWWEEKKNAAEALSFKPFAFDFPEPESSEIDAGALYFTTYPTVQFFDGREANRLWIQEIPDPVTQATWGGWLEINIETAKRLGVEKGDLIRVKSPHGTTEAPVLPVNSMPPGVLAIPIGQGHTTYGRFANGLPANPMSLFPPATDPLSGGILPGSLLVEVEKTKKTIPIANTDGSFSQYGREFVQTVNAAHYKDAVDSGHAPHLYMPLPEGYDPEQDFYPAHAHVDYRWAMVVDIDRCVGCAACVAACYAENNVGIVGREQVLKGREMSWLRVQRYFDGEKIRWLPMLCQHCDNAPCESVCPVYAPHHSKEGLNNQVYNRCFGTRFCSQNDPYKVRRFNWFTWTRPKPLDLQLNPDVTVRQKGIMEKCSFCVHRIVEAKVHARNEGRKVRDGEFTTACAQTCPTGALVFGNLLDPESRVSQLIKDPRTYQVLQHLNTKPAVFYLKKVTPVVEV